MARAFQNGGCMSEQDGGVQAVPGNYLPCFTVKFELGRGFEMGPVIAGLKTTFPEFVITDGDNRWQSKIIAEPVALLGTIGSLGVWVELRYCAQFILPAIVDDRIQALNMASIVFYVGHNESRMKPIAEENLGAAKEIAEKIQRKFVPPDEQLNLLEG